MGGNALKKVTTNRMNKETYINIKKELNILFQDKLQIEFLFDLTDKESFGDIDILCNGNGVPVIDILKLNYDSVEIFKNGNIISFAYLYNELYYQIDLISVNNFIMSRFYLSYGVTGHIIGHMVNKLNFKYGDHGLSLHIDGNTIKQYDDGEYDDRYLYGIVHLTNNPQEICDFFGLDYYRWTTGFDSSLELFKWLCNSNIYSHKYFINTNLDKHRQQYVDFITYSSNYGANLYEPTIDFSSIMTINYFNKVQDVKKIILDIKLNLERKSKFNGNMIIEKGLKESNIGKCIKFIKISVTNNKINEFDQWIDEHNHEFIKQNIDELIKEFYTHIDAPKSPV